MWLGNFNDPGSQGRIKFTHVTEGQNEITQTHNIPEYISQYITSFALLATKYFCWILTITFSKYCICWITTLTTSMYTKKCPHTPSPSKTLPLSHTHTSLQIFITWPTTCLFFGGPVVIPGGARVSDVLGNHWFGSFPAAETLQLPCWYLIWLLCSLTHTRTQAGMHMNAHTMLTQAPASHA